MDWSSNSCRLSTSDAGTSRWVRFSRLYRRKRLMRSLQYGLYTVLAGKGMGAALERTGEPWPVAAKKFSANPDLHQLSVPEFFAVRDLSIGWSFTHDF